jgi:hypothetical protein
MVLRMASGDFVGFVAVAKAHGACCCNGGGFDHAKKFEAELSFHGWPSSLSRIVDGR